MGYWPTETQPLYNTPKLTQTHPFDTPTELTVYESFAFATTTRAHRKC